MVRSTAPVGDLTPEPAPPADLDAPAEAPAEPEIVQKPATSWRPSPERILLAILLVGAALVRFVAAGQLEPNVSNVEASHLAAIEAMLVDRGAGLFGLTDAGASDLALGPPTLFRLFGREPELALRLYAGIGGLVLVAAFYALCRAQFPIIVSLAAAALLAFSPTSIYFGRNGEMNGFVVLWMVAALWLLARAAKHGGPRTWALAGAVSAIGLYWHPTAIWATPALVLVGLYWLNQEPVRRPQLAAGLVVFVVAALVVAGPRMAQLATHGNVVAATLDEHGTGTNVTPAPGIRGRVQQAVRTYLLLDPTVPGEVRYVVPGRAPIDGLTGILLFVGIGLAIWRPARHAPALILFAVPLIGSQLTSPLVPDPGRAVVAMVGLYLLVAGALDRILAVLPVRSVMLAGLLVAIPVYAVSGWQAYVAWMSAPTVAQTRQPALDYDEVDTWLAEQHARLVAGQDAASVAEWRQAHPRLTTGPRAARRSPNTAPSVDEVGLSSLTLTQTQAIQGERDANAARGVAALPSGEVVVADQAGRVSRLDGERGTVAPVSASPSLQQISEVAVDSNGQLLLLDAERSLLVRLDPRGTVLSTLGADWGMYHPRGMAIGPDGTIYVADTGRNRIVVASSDGRLIKSLGPRTSAGDLEQPTDVAVDATGRIYVAMPEISRMTVLDQNGEVLGGWPLAKGDTIDSPHLAVVADGAVAITEPAARRVWIADADGREIASAQTGGRPYGVATSQGRLYVTDLGSGRVLTFSLRGR